MVVRDLFEYVGIDGRIILKWIFLELWRMDRIYVAQDRDQLRAVVKTVMNRWCLNMCVWGEGGLTS
jgi:hypothetical protein